MIVLIRPYSAQLVPEALADHLGNEYRKAARTQVEILGYIRQGQVRAVEVLREMEGAVSWYRPGFSRLTAA